MSSEEDDDRRTVAELILETREDIERFGQGIDELESHMTRARAVGYMLLGWRVLGFRWSRGKLRGRLTILERHQRRLQTPTGRHVDTPIIARPPGQWMLTVASTVFSKRTRERIFKQVVSDFRAEYFEAITERANRARMAFLTGRHWCGFVLSFAMQAGREVAKAIKTLKGAG